MDMVTPRAADVTALSVTGQISGSHHGWSTRLEPIASLACTPRRASQRAALTAVLIRREPETARACCGV